ncbi:Serpin B9 [Halotydeus destructor]|nr:Serpin B9 [Halotydeus destructor]
MDTAAENKADFVYAVNAFGFRLLAQLRQDKNTLVSGPSVVSLLAFLIKGASGETLKQLEGVFEETLEPNMEHAKDFLYNAYLARQGMELAFKNRLLLARHLKVDEGYKQFLRQFDIKIESVNFEENAQAIMSDLNRWVANITANQIDNALEHIDSSTRLLMLNAVFFKDAWMTPFERNESLSLPFDGKPTPHGTFMVSRGRYAAVSEPELGYRLVCIPYKNFTGSLYVILPPPGFNAADVDFHTLNSLIELVADTPKTNVNLVLPTFKLDASFNVAQLLRVMGVQDAFDLEKADFSRMSPDNDIVVGNITQRITVAVDEKGTTAAALTCDVSDGEPADYEDWIIDRPFIYVIRDDLTQLQYFAGVMKDLTFA